MIRFEDENGHSIYWYDAADVAKFLNIKDTATKRVVGRNKFIQFLRHNGAIMKDSNQPTQYWIQLGLSRFHRTTKRWKTYGMPLFSDKGIAYIQNKIDSGVWVLDYEKRKMKNEAVLKDIC